MLKYNFSNLDFDRILFDNDMHEWARAVYLMKGWYEKKSGIFSRKIHQVSGPGNNYWAHIMTIFEVEYYNQKVFRYPIGRLHQFEFF